MKDKRKVEAKRNPQKPVSRRDNLKRLEGFTDEVDESGIIIGA